MVRVSKEKKIININASIPKLTEYLSKRPDIAAAYIFGSYGTEYQTPLSDVDIGVLFVGNKKPNIDIILEISSILTEITGEEDINMVVLNTAPITLQYEVVSKGKVLFKKSTYLEDFHEYLFKRYGDFVLDLDRFNAEYDEALREAYIND